MVKSKRGNKPNQLNLDIYQLGNHNLQKKIIAQLSKLPIYSIQHTQAVYKMALEIFNPLIQLMPPCLVPLMRLT